MSVCLCESNKVSTAPARPGGVMELLAVALPLIASQACDTVMMFTDRLFLARLGPEYLAAAMGGGLTCFLFMTFFFGLTGYVAALVAQYLGAGQKVLCARVTAQALIVCLLAYPLMLLCFRAGHWQFAALGLAPAQLEPQRIYFDILLAGSLVGFLRGVLAAFFSGLGRSRVVLTAAGASLVANVLADYLLIFGRWGSPAWGIAGAAVATLLGGLAGLAILAGEYFSRPYRREFAILANLGYDRALMGRLWRLGAPAGLELMLTVLAFNLLVFMFHSYGVTVAAALTIAFNWDLVSFIPLAGLGLGVTSLVGRYLGAGDAPIAQRVARAGLFLAAGYSAVTFTVFVLLPGPLVEMFRPAGEAGDFAAVVPLAEFMVRLVSLYVFSDAISLVCAGALRGAGDTFWTMVISVAGHWVFALAAVTMIGWGGVDARLAWTVSVGLFAAQGVTYWLRYRRGHWLTLRTAGEIRPERRDVDPQPAFS